MQEEVENRTVTLTISGAKLTGRTLKWAIRQFLNHHSKSQAKKAQAAAITPRGKQSVAELVGQNQGVQNIEISDKNIKDFDRVALTMPSRRIPLKKSRSIWSFSRHGTATR